MSRIQIQIKKNFIFRKFSQKVSNFFIKSFENSHKKPHLYLYYTHIDIFFVGFSRNFLDRFDEIDKKYDFCVQFEYNTRIYETITKDRRTETI